MDTASEDVTVGSCGGGGAGCTKGLQSQTHWQELPQTWTRKAKAKCGRRPGTQPCVPCWGHLLSSGFLLLDLHQGPAQRRRHLRLPYSRADVCSHLAAYPHAKTKSTSTTSISGEASLSPGHPSGRCDSQGRTPERDPEVLCTREHGTVRWHLGLLSR